MKKLIPILLAVFASDDSEVSPATIRFLIDKAMENKSKTILKIELVTYLAERWKVLFLLKSRNLLSRNFSRQITKEARLCWM